MYIYIAQSGGWTHRADSGPTAYASPVGRTEAPIPSYDYILR